MPRTIAAPVGTGGISLPADTKTIQQLLNAVPLTEGGPSPKLRDDGKCDPFTKAAISRFQARQLGWKANDGRVDPNGATLARLNEFDKALALPLQTGNESTDFFLIHMSSKLVSIGSDEDMFFQVHDSRTGAVAVYWIDRLERGKPSGQIPKAGTWAGSGGPFKLQKARRLRDLEVHSAWMTNSIRGELSSELGLFFPDTMVRLAMNHHIYGPDGKPPVNPSANIASSTGAAGRFRLISGG